MTAPVFHSALSDPLPAVGATVQLDGAEGHHAAVVRRIRPGETIVVSDGTGRGVRAVVAEVTRSGLSAAVVQTLTAQQTALPLSVAQALAKGERGELAVEMLTEVGVDRILPWQSARSVVRWSGDRGARGVEKWRSTAREATKQSRRLRIPEVTDVVGTAALAREVAATSLALLLDGDAPDHLADVVAAQLVADPGSVLLIVGPEGGVAPEEAQTLLAAGARAVSLGDGVLRTSTAGVVGVTAVLTTAVLTAAQRR